jgi:hypothetical protein
MTLEKLDKINTCRFLLPAPSPEIVGELVEELRRYVIAMDKIYKHNEESRCAVIKYFGTTHFKS